MIQTTGFRTGNALRFVNAVSGGGSNLYMVLGKQTPWSSADGSVGFDNVNPPSDSNPLVPTSSTIVTSLCESAPTPYVAIPATAQWVVEDDALGTVQVRDATQGIFRAFDIFGTEAAANTDGVLLVLLSGVVYGDLMPYSSFRIVGFVTDLVPASGHASDNPLLAANVTNWGRLEAVEFRVPASVVSGDGYTLNQIAGF